MTTDNLREGGHKGPSFSRRTFAKAAGVSAAALAIGASGASLAWFTGRDVKENKLSIAQNLNIRVVEPAWDPENAKSIVPNQHIPKDPRIENLSDEFSGWMVVEIRVPTAVVSVFDEGEQKVLDPARTPLFSFVADPQWTLLQQFEDGDEDVYRFGWPETIPALGQTPPIFEEVVVANLAEAQGQSGSKTITATGYGIQSEGLSNIATAWEAYKKQNGIGDGEPDKRIVSAVTAGTLLKFVEGVPEVGDEVDGKTIGEVVPDIEHLPAQDKTPLTSTPEAITYVDGTTPTTPENTVNWFKDMDKVEEMDIFGITVAEDAAVDGMFDGTTALKKVHVNDSSKIVQALPEGFEQTVPGGVYEPAGNYEFWMTRKDGYIIKPQEIIAAANDISKNGTTSQYYAEYHDYLVNGGDWDPVSNEPGSTFGQALEDGYGLMHILWGDGREYTARIIGMIHDERADGAGKAGLTFQFTGLLYDPQRFNPKVSNFGGWRDSELRFRMNPTELGNESVLMSGANNDHLVWNSVPRSLQSAITTVSKLTKNRDDGTSTTAEMNKIPETSTTDKLWLISQYELCSDNNGRTTQNEGLQYEKYKAMTKWDSIYSHPMLKKFEAKKNLNSPKPDTSRLWWLRTMNNEDTYEFVCSINNGYSYNSNYATYLRFIAPCFCI